MPALPKRTVDEAVSPLEKAMRVEVEFAGTPKGRGTGVKGKAPEPATSAAQPNEPASQVRTLPLLQVRSWAPYNCVVEAAPVFEMLKRVVVALPVEDATAKSVVFVSPLLAWTESLA